MAHNQEMLEKHAELGDWKNVRIIGLSRDKDQNALEQRVTEKKWTSVEQYWQANGKSEAHKDYKVNGIPHCVLVDTHGKIVWVGHPMSRNLEEDITNLLAGKTLDVKASADSDEKEGESNPTAGLDYDKAVEAVKLFEAETKSLQEPEAVERAKDVPRAFLVLVN